jgi:hypothetical protein
MDGETTRWIIGGIVTIAIAAIGMFNAHTLGRIGQVELNIKDYMDKTDLRFADIYRILTTNADKQSEYRERMIREVAMKQDLTSMENSLKQYFDSASRLAYRQRGTVKDSTNE